MGYYAIKKAGEFPCLKHFKAPVDYSNLNYLAEKLKSIPCKNLSVVLHKASITLPSLDIFRKFVNGVAFYQGQISELEVKLINEAMVTWYEKECKKHWQGNYLFNCSLYLVTGEK